MNGYTLGSFFFFAKGIYRLAAGRGLHALLGKGLQFGISLVMIAIRINLL